MYDTLWPGVNQSLSLFPNRSRHIRGNDSLNVFGYILIPMTILGTISNFAVAVSILRNRKLRNESINHLILSVCLADCVILLMDRPILAYIFVTIYSTTVEGRPISESWCRAETFFETFGMTALLLNLAILSFERFLTIRHPLEISKKKQRIAFFATASWIASFGCGLGAILAPAKSYHFNLCQLSIWSKWGYFDYLVIPLGAVTTFVIALMYALIMGMVRAHVSSTSNSLSKTKTDDGKAPPVMTFHNKVNQESRTMNPVPLLHSPATSIDMEKKAPEPPIPVFVISSGEKSSEATSAGSLVRQPSDTQRSALQVEQLDETALPSSRRRTTVDVYDAAGNVTVEVVSTQAGPVGAVCRFNPKNREAARRRMELATAKKSLAIVASFLLCWLPLPLCHLTFTGRIDGHHGTWYTFLPTLTLTLAAAINPCVYAFVNKQIRQSGIELWHSAFQGFKVLFFKT